MTIRSVQLQGNLAKVPPEELSYLRKVASPVLPKKNLSGTDIKEIRIMSRGKKYRDGPAVCGINFRRSKELDKKMKKKSHQTQLPGGISFRSGADFYFLPNTASLQAFATRNLTTVLAGI